MNKMAIGIAVFSAIWSIFIIKFSIDAIREIRMIQKRIRDKNKYFDIKFNK